MTRRQWTDAEREVVRGLYATHSASEIGAQIGRSNRAIYLQATELGLKKPDGWASECTRTRWKQGKNEGSRVGLVRGHGWNKGIKGSTGNHPNCRRTQFKKGMLTGAAQHNYVSVGSTRISKDGYLERKVTDNPDIYPARRWVGVHRLVWEAANGAIPAGHIVVFRTGARTADEALITVDRLELITRGENMRRNSYHTRYPKEVAQLIQLRGALNRQINKRDIEK